MVYGWYIHSYWDYNPTYNWGGTTLHGNHPKNPVITDLMILIRKFHLTASGLIRMSTCDVLWILHQSMVKDNIVHGCNVAPPNVISWFITLSNYSYNNHKSQWLWFETNLAILWGPTSENGSFIIISPNKKYHNVRDPRFICRQLYFYHFRISCKDFMFWNNNCSPRSIVRSFFQNESCCLTLKVQFRWQNPIADIPKLVNSHSSHEKISIDNKIIGIIGQRSMMFDSRETSFQTASSSPWKSCRKLDPHDFQNTSNSLQIQNSINSNESPPSW